MEYSDLRQNLKERTQERIDFRRDFSDEEVRDIIDEVIVSSEETALVNLKERRRLRKDIFDSLRKLDVLQKYVDDPTVTEIMINGLESIYVEKDGYLKKTGDRFESEEKLRDVIQQIVAGCNRVVNESSPIVDARLDNGSRVNIVMNPVALNGPIITIRRFPDKPLTMEKLIAVGAITEEAVSFLKMLVRAKYNIFISGGTGSGKTTFLNALSGFIPGDERVITIEDSAELQLQGIGNLVRLETRNSNTEGCDPISIRDLIKSSLRMRPDRLIIGEVRGAEAWDLVVSLNTGHDGSMSTGHSNSSKDMISRLENMVLMGAEIPLNAIKQQIASGLDIIVHLGRLRDKTRKVMEITEVLGYENGEIITKTLYKFDETGTSFEGKVLGRLEKKCNLQNTGKLRLAGLSPSQLEKG
jgi:pilus assembly protein CpaF